MNILNQWLGHWVYPTHIVVYSILDLSQKLIIDRFSVNLILDFIQVNHGMTICVPNKCLYLLNNCLCGTVSHSTDPAQRGQFVLLIPPGSSV